MFFGRWHVPLSPLKKYTQKTTLRHQKLTFPPLPFHPLQRYVFISLAFLPRFTLFSILIRIYITLPISPLVMNGSRGMAVEIQKHLSFFLFFTFLFILLLLLLLQNSPMSEKHFSIKQKVNFSKTKKKVFVFKYFNC